MSTREKPAPAETVIGQATLIARLEKAVRPSRELDRDVAEAFGWERKVVSQSEDDYWRLGDMTWTRESAEHPPYYTASIDAALMMVPEPTVSGDKGRVVESRFDFGRSIHFATVNYDHHGRGAMPALALCIAALRAREAAP